MSMTNVRLKFISPGGGGGRSEVLLGILGGGVPPGSPNTDLDSLKAHFRFLLVRFYLD